MASSFSLSDQASNDNQTEVTQDNNVLSRVGFNSYSPNRPRYHLWTVDEDKALFRHVALHGTKNWKLISSKLPGRSVVGCRRRWCRRTQNKKKSQSSSPPSSQSISSAPPPSSSPPPPPPPPPRLIDFMGVGSG